MTRRQFVAACLVFATGFVALALAWPLPLTRRIIARLLAPRLDRGSDRGRLSPDEMASAVAFAEVLVEDRPFTEDERGGVVEHIAERTEHHPGYLALYRMTAALLDRHAATRFAALDHRARTRLVLARRFLPDVRPRDYLVTFDRRELAVRVLAAPDLIEGFYDSPAGWASIGYRQSPGRCGDLLRYTRPEG
jgi:hypothetical protein